MMVDLQKVCCLCGDIGFPDNLFRCDKCHHRFQHSYCSNYYGELAEIGLCDWCQREEKNARLSSSGSYNNPSRSSEAAGKDVGSTTSRSEYSRVKIKQHHHDREDQSGGGSSDKGKTAATGGAPSPRQSTRRYKLLKDVMC